MASTWQHDNHVVLYHGWIQYQHWLAEQRAYTNPTSGSPSIEDEEESDGGCTNPLGHEWEYTGTAYGGDDASYHGEGRCYCMHCGADGDA